MHAWWFIVNKTAGLLTAIMARIIENGIKKPRTRGAGLRESCRKVQLWGTVTFFLVAGHGLNGDHLYEVAEKVSVWVLYGNNIPKSRIGGGFFTRSQIDGRLPVA